MNLLKEALVYLCFLMKRFSILFYGKIFYSYHFAAMLEVGVRRRRRKIYCLSWKGEGFVGKSLDTTITSGTRAVTRTNTQSGPGRDERARLDPGAFSPEKFTTMQRRPCSLFLSTKSAKPSPEMFP